MVVTHIQMAESPGASLGGKGGEALRKDVLRVLVLAVLFERRLLDGADEALPADAADDAHRRGVVGQLAAAAGLLGLLQVLGARRRRLKEEGGRRGGAAVRGRGAGGAIAGIFRWILPLIIPFEHYRLPLLLVVSRRRFQNRKMRTLAGVRAGTRSYTTNGCVSKRIYAWRRSAHSGVHSSSTPLDVSSVTSFTERICSLVCAPRGTLSIQTCTTAPAQDIRRLACLLGGFFICNLTRHRAHLRQRPTGRTGGSMMLPCVDVLRPAYCIAGSWSLPARRAPQPCPTMPHPVSGGGAARPQRAAAAPTHRPRASSVATSAGGAGAEKLATGGAVSLRYGVASVQGPRDTMEDVTQVIENAPCDFLFASEFFLM